MSTPPRASTTFQGCELWLVDLAASGRALDALERDRAVLPAASASWDAERKCAHVAARLLLVRAGGAAAGVPFHTSAAGKPALPGGPEFSLSHTASWVLVGLSRTGCIGVDIELKARPLKMSAARATRLRAAGQALAPESRLPDGDKNGVLQAWVRLEACGKAAGTGVGRLLAAHGVMARGTSGSSLPPATALDVFDLDLGAALLGAVALPTGQTPPAVAVLPSSLAEIERLIRD